MADTGYMEKWGKMFRNSFLLALLLFVIIRLTWGFYYEEYEAVFDAFYSGKMSPGTPFYSWYFMGNIGISYLYAGMYQLIGGIEWMSWVLYFYLLLSSSLILFLVRYLLDKKLLPSSILAVQVFVCVIVLCDNVVHFNFTRVSYFMCGSSLFGLIFLFPDWASIKKNVVPFILLNIFFLMGVLTRLEPAMAVTGLLFVFGFYFCSSLFQLARLFVFPALVVATVFGGIMFDIKHTDFFYKQVEPDIETQITSRENYVPLSAMKTQADSLKYLAGINLIWGDPKIVTPKFLRSLLTKDTAFFRDERQWRRTTHEMGELLKKYWYIAVFNWFLAALYFIQSYRSTSWQSKGLFLLFQLSIWVMVATQTYYVKVNERSFFPIFCLFSFANIILVLQYITQSNFFIRLAVLLTGIFGGIMQARATTLDAITLHREREDYRYNLDVLHQVTGDNIIVLNSSSYRFFMVNNMPFKPFDFSRFYRVYMNEVQVLSTVHTYHEYLEKECNCDVDDISNFYRFLQKSGKKVYFLSMEDRMDLTRKYLHGIHNYDLELKEVKVPGFRPVYDHEMAYIVELKVYTFK